MARLFRHSYLFQLYQPTYASGHYSFMLASDQIHPFTSTPDWEAWRKKKIATRYYNPDLHYASFLLPTQLQTVVHGVPRLHQLAPHLFPFVLTSAWEQLRLSLHPANANLKAALSAAGIGGAHVVTEAADAFDARVAAEEPYNVVTPGLSEYPLVGQFVSTLLCVGHVKSTEPDDLKFVEAFKDSPKWLKMRG